ncbi:glutathione-dependent formaldehyde dehydrogenase, partial [Mesorhizobium sp. BR1-1-7]|nr:glutathione-dependent formaldehyde dehydrogenase [Mesorhizobium sp. BR1-1-7]
IGLVDHIPFGAAMNKGLTFRMGQTHTQRYLDPLLQKVLNGDIDPAFVITHRAGLDEGPGLYKTFRDKQDGCIKVVMRPHG